jgi:hypothetical protein
MMLVDILISLYSIVPKLEEVVEVEVVCEVAVCEVVE